MDKVNRAALHPHPTANPLTVAHRLRVSALVPRLSLRFSSHSSVWLSPVPLFKRSFFPRRRRGRGPLPLAQDAKIQTTIHTVHLSRTIFFSHLHHDLHEHDTTWTHHLRYRITKHNHRRTLSAYWHCYILYPSPTCRIQQIHPAGRSSLTSRT